MANEQIKGWFQVWFNDVCVFLTVTRSRSCVSCLSVKSRAKHLHEKNQKTLKNKTGWELMSDGGAPCVLCIKCDVLEAAQAKDSSSLFCFYFDSYSHLSPLKTLSSSPLHPRCIFFLNTNDQRPFCFSIRRWFFQTANKLVNQSQRLWGTEATTDAAISTIAAGRLIICLSAQSVLWKKTRSKS